MFPISSGPSVVDIHKTKAPQLYAAAITTYVLAVIAVALRFSARRLNKKFGIGWDDWTVTVALVCFRNKVQLIEPLSTLTVISVRHHWVLRYGNCLQVCQIYHHCCLNVMLIKHSIALHQGFGEHYEVLSDSYAITIGKALFAEEILYCAVIGLVKLSILTFYWRLFNPHTSTQISCYILGTIVICWEIAVVG